jgi:uncharacterized protein (DUF362 family)
MNNPSIPLKRLFAGKNFRSLIFFLTGLTALTWFLVRVIPKPSRATYPCMQAAFPMASAFVIWVTGILTSSLIFIKAKARWNRSKYLIALMLYSLALSTFMVTSTSLKHTPAVAQTYINAGLLPEKPIPVMRDFAGDSCVVDPAAFVCIVKSSQAQAQDIVFGEIEAMVSEVIEKAGGLADIISDGDTVILKPNLVCSADGTANPQQLSPEVNGITTDYRVVQAVVNLVRGINPTGKIYVMEGSAMGSTVVNMAILNYGLITGIDSLICLEDASGDWGDTSSVYLQGVSLPPGKALYVGANNRYWLHKLYYNADVVISMPVLKNHCYAGTTGSVKNVGIGATPATIYAYEPNILRWRIDHENPLRTNLHYFIHDFFMCRPVDFVLMDGLQSIQNGPASTSTTQQLSDDQMNMRLILAGKDPIAVDAIGALLTGHDPELIPHLVTLHNDSLGCCDARLIRVNGNKVGDEKKDFEIYDTGTLSKYDDFEGPSFSVNECYVIGNQLYFSLSVDDEVSKVEVSVDSIYLNQIVIGGFENFFLDLDTLEITTGTTVTVYAYDQYLNYSFENLIVTTVPDEEISAYHQIKVTIAPNPAHGIVDCQFGIVDFQRVSLKIYDLFGRELRVLVDEVKSPGEYRVRMDVSALPAGVYLVMLQADGQSAVRKLVLE